MCMKFESKANRREGQERNVWGYPTCNFLCTLWDDEVGDEETCFTPWHWHCSVFSICPVPSPPLVRAHNSYNILRISKSSANAVAHFVHAVGSIGVTQCGFGRLTEKRDLAESIASMSFKSNPLEQLEAISFCDRRAHQPSHGLPPHHLLNSLHC